MGGPVALACEVCGAAPTALVTVRGHQGMVVLMRSLRRDGTFCRTCGLAVFRQMQTDTLWQGWWGPLSLVITPVILLMNLGTLSAIRRLPQPSMPGPRPSLDPGKPVLGRPAGLIAAAPLALLALAVVAVPVLIVVGALTGGGDDKPVPLTVGSCARNDSDWPDQDLKPVPCDSSDAQYEVDAPGDGECRAGDFIAYPEYSKDGTTSFCLHSVAP